MKKLLIITALSILSFSNIAFAGEKANIHVNGMVCDFCARALEKVFGREDAVQSIEVDLDNQLITVFFKEGQDMDDETLTYLVTDSGYNVDTISRKKAEASPNE